MKVGDLVKDNHPSWKGAERIGVLISESPRSTKLNRQFIVLWRDGAIGHYVWDYDLKIVKSS